MHHPPPTSLSHSKRDVVKCTDTVYYMLLYIHILLLVVYYILYIYMILQLQHGRQECQGEDIKGSWGSHWSVRPLCPETLSEPCSNREIKPSLNILNGCHLAEGTETDHQNHQTAQQLPSLSHLTVELLSCIIPRMSLVIIYSMSQDVCI